MAIRETYVGGPLVRWSAVVAGTVIGFALMVLLSARWVALGEGTGVDAIADNLHWFAFGSAVLALLIAGFVAGALSGVPGVGTGLLHGLTVWGLVLIVAVIVSTPQALQLFETLTTPLDEVGEGALWATFFSLLIGLVAAAIGGIIGGAVTRPMAATAVADDAVYDRDSAYARRDDRVDDRRADDRIEADRRADDRIEADRRARAETTDPGPREGAAGGPRSPGDTTRTEERTAAGEPRRDERA